MFSLKLSSPHFNQVKWVLVSIIGFTVLSLSASAQGKVVKNSNQQWIQYYGHAKIGGKWTVFADGGYRVEDNFSKRAQYIARVAMGYSLNPSISLAAGFANSGLYSSAELSKEEFRPYEELGIHQRVGKMGFSHRFRVEERFFNPVVNHRILHPGTFDFRFRYSFMAAIPVINLSKGKPGSRILLDLGDEIFLNAGKNIVYNYFDQNRIILSPTLEINPHLSLSLAWNNQFASTTTAGTYHHTQVMWLQIKQGFDFSRKKH